MKKTVCFLFIVLFFISCSRAHATSASFDVRTTLIGFSAPQEKRVKSASSLIRKIVRSAEFKEQIINHSWNGSRRFADNGGLSNEQIFHKILKGTEMQTDLGPNNTMDLEIELYTDNESITIGYTYPSIVRIYMNTKYFNKFRPYQVADNMMHEWLHKIGFAHAVKDTPERPYSVPYAVGYIVKKISHQMNQERRRKALNLLLAQKPSSAE